MSSYDPVVRAEEVARQAIDGSVYAVQTYIEEDFVSLGQYVTLRLIDPKDQRHFGVSIYLIRSREAFENAVRDTAIKIRERLDMDARSGVQRR